MSSRWPVVVGGKPESGPLTATRFRGDARCAGTQSGSGEALRQVGPAVLYLSSPGLLVLRALQVGSEVPGRTVSCSLV